MPTFATSHGGGPQFGPGPKGEAHRLWLAQVASLLPRPPKAILVISAHFIEPVATLTTGSHQKLYFDYGGFPPKTYREDYFYPEGRVPPGFDAALIARVQQLFADAGVPLALDDKRQLDHGVFVPLSQERAFDSVPTAQLSLVASLDAAEHIKLGEILRPLRDEGVLIIGSGASTHGHGGPRDADGVVGVAFNEWLERAMTERDYAKRVAALVAWEKAPHAHDAHPAGGFHEHLVPYFTVAGAGGDDQKITTHTHTPMGWVSKAFFFE